MPKRATISGKAEAKNGVLPEGFTSLTERYALLSRLVARDLNKAGVYPTFARYKKEEINNYLSNPYVYQKQLRQAITYIYGASSHFRRIIKYFAGLSYLSYVVEPYKIDPKKANIKTVRNNYRKVMNTLSNMNIETQFRKVLTVCLKEDTFYGTFWVTSDDIAVQQLPSDYCDITVVEGKVPNVTFDFSYFDSHPAYLDYYPPEFRQKYKIYTDNRLTQRWIELDSPNSFAVKCNDEILEYPLPPFAGILREVYDIEDYKQLKKSKTALENYALLAMKLPMDDESEWGLDYNKAKKFWENLDAVLPEEVGSVLSPMDIEKISFERTHPGDTTAVAEAEDSLFTAAGISSLLFNSRSPSANALLLSIKADQAITYEIVKNIENVINRFIQSQNYGKNFRVNFLDVSRFNRDESGTAYLKACQYGMPMISYYCASQGLNQAQVDSMSYLEAEVLGLQQMFKPLVSSTQMSSKDLESNAATDEGGAPTKGVGEISESGEANQETA